MLAGGDGVVDGGAATCKTGAGDKSLAVLAPLPPPGSMTLSTHRAQCAALQCTSSRGAWTVFVLILDSVNCLIKDLRVERREEEEILVRVWCPAVLV